jgi:intein/homing endonuclease
MPNEYNKNLFGRLTKLFRSGPVVRRRVKGMNQKTGTASTALEVFRAAHSDVYNSTLSSYGAFDRMCVSLDTKIPIPGPEKYLTMGELIERYSDGEKFIVYAYDVEKGELTPAWAHHPRSSGVRKTVRITFDDGSHLICTPDHPCMMRDGTFRDAGELSPGDSMMPFYRKDFQGHGYYNIYTAKRSENSWNGWRAEHHLIAEWSSNRRIKKGIEHVHHIDFNPSNNRPENLAIMDAKEHLSYHARLSNHNRGDDYRAYMSRLKKQAWENNDEQGGEWRKNLTQFNKRSEVREMRRQHMLLDNPSKRKEVAEKISQKQSERYQSPDERATASAKMKELHGLGKIRTSEAFSSYWKGRRRSDEWKQARSGDNHHGWVDIDIKALTSLMVELKQRKLVAEAMCLSPATVGRRAQSVLGGDSWEENVRRAQSYSAQNHRVVSVEPWETIETGDLTVDGYENFATNTIVVHNSRYSDFSEMEATPEIASALDIYSEETAAQGTDGRILHIHSDNRKVQELLEDLFYDTINVEFNLPMWVRNLPVHKDTIIPLLDGTDLTIESLAKRMQEEPEWQPWVYSVQDGTHRTVPGRVSWCGLTRKDSPLVRVWLDDGSYLDCTPDHKFTMRDGSAKEAQHLTKDESLMPFYRKISSRDEKNSLDGYEQVYDARTNRFVYTHRRVSEILEEGTLRTGRHLVTHHIDFNKKNNDPANLVRMDEREHWSLHAENATRVLHSPDVTLKRMKGIDRWLRSDRHRALVKEQLVKLQQEGLMRSSWRDYNSSEKHKLDNVVRSGAMKKAWQSRKSELCDSMKLKFDHRCLDLMIERAASVGVYKSPKSLGRELLDDERFMSHFLSINEKTKRDLTKPLRSRDGIESLLAKLGYVSYLTFVKERLPEIASTPWFKRAEKKSLAMKGTVPIMQSFIQKNRDKNPSNKLTNHKVDRVEWLQDRSDVYCMEVLGPNGEHDRHRFMTLTNRIDENGVISKNSSGICLENCKYGDFFLFNDVSPDYGVLNCIPISISEIEREEGFDPSDPMAVRYRWITQGNRVLENWQVTHFRLLGNDAFLPYGSSVLEGARRIWRQLILIEDAMLVYRVIRAPERRVFYIDVGNVPPEEISNYLEQAQSSLKRNEVVDKSTGRVDLRFNPMAVDQDYFLPVRGGESGTKIDTLAGGQNTAAIEDVQYIQKKLFAALKIPKAYLGYDEETGCFTGDTRISLLDGREVEIERLVEEHSEGKQNWVHSCDPSTGRIVPGRVVTAWKTKDVTSLVEVTIDTGDVLRCTDNHPFLLRDGTYVRADELVQGQSLMPLRKRFTRSKKFGGEDLLDGYEQVFDNSDNEWKYTHKVISDFERGSDPDRIRRSRVVHHVDFNKRNNEPTNLLEMTWSDHRRLHSERVAETLLHPDVVAKREPKRVAALKSEKHREKKRNQLRSQHSDPGSLMSKWVRSDGLRESVSKSISASWQRSEYRERIQESSRSLWKKEGYRAQYMGDSHWSRRSRSEFDIGWLRNFCIEHHVTSINQWRADHGRSVWEISPVGIRYVNNLIRREGFANWKAFKKSVSYNHKVLSIRRIELASPVPVFDLEIEGWHNFAVIPGGVNSLSENGDEILEQNIHPGCSDAIFVHNSKATLAQEDIRFSRSIQRIQKTVIAELNKLAMIHLYSHGYEGEDLMDFTLKLSNPSSIAQQQKLELISTKFDIAGKAPEGLVSRQWIRKNILELTDQEIEQLKEQREDDKLEDAAVEKAGAEEDGAEGGGGAEEGDTEGGDEAGGEGDLGGLFAGDRPEGDLLIATPDGGPTGDFDKDSTDEETDEDDFIPPSIDDVSAPIKIDNRIQRTGKKLNMFGEPIKRSRKQTRGAASTGLHDFAMMTGLGNTQSTLRDPYQKNWIKNPLSVGEGLSSTPDVEFGRSRHFVHSLDSLKNFKKPGILREAGSSSGQDGEVLEVDLNSLRSDLGDE